MYCKLIHHNQYPITIRYPAKQHSVSDKTTSGTSLNRAFETHIINTGLDYELDLDCGLDFMLSHSLMHPSFFKVSMLQNFSPTFYGLSVKIM